MTARPRSLSVADVMTTDVESCRPADDLATAACRLWDGDCGILPVLDGNRVVAVITDRDIAIALAFAGCRPGERTVASVARQEPVTCAPDEPLAAALTRMADHQLRRLPVVEAGRLVGMLSINDLILASHRPGAASPRAVIDALRAIAAHRRRPAVAP